MHWLNLPEPRKNIVLAFQDVASARAWLANQPQAQALHMLAALRTQIEAIDSAGLAPALAVELLNLLRRAAVPAQAAIEPRYFRKALPLPEDDERSFEAAQQLWTRLGIAYMRLTPHFPPAEKGLPLNRAACALRMAQYCHFQAARQSPALLDHLLFGVLAQAASNKLLREPLADPDFPHLGDSNIAGHLAWAFLLRLIDPYRLTATQLIVANRAISRWRELASFLVAPDSDPKARNVDLAPLYGGPLPEGVPCWLEVRSVIRKIRQRIESLAAGQSPESLKLGRELSASACSRLLKELEASLRSQQRETSTEIGELEIAFGGEHAYAVIKGEFLNPVGNLDASSASLAHQRMALFGFDRVSQMPTAVKKLNVPGETWTMVDGMAVRAADQEGARRLAPCLIASRVQGKPRLGVLFGLQMTAANALTAGLHWYDERVEAGYLKRLAPHDQRAPKVPAFLLRADDAISLILPASAAARLEFGLALEGTSIEHLVPTEVLERGVDFVRYACRRA
ncbi:MAG TPA: hypothetical protein VJ572_08805 [Azonexus sp.]|nr:hypothetical protein [Azonexus sp.]